MLEKIQDIAVITFGSAIAAMLLIILIHYGLKIDLDSLFDFVNFLAKRSLDAIVIVGCAQTVKRKSDLLIKNAKRDRK